MSWRTLGIPVKVVLALLAVALVVWGGWTALAARAELARLDAELDASAGRRAERLAVSLRGAAFAIDRATAVDVLRAELADEEVAGVAIEAEPLRVVLSRLGGAVVPARPSLEGTLVRASREMEDPVGGPGLGEVTVWLTPAPALAAMRDRAVRHTLELGLLTVGLAIGMGLILHVALVRPLERLRAALLAGQARLRAGLGRDLPVEDPLAGQRGAFAELEEMGRHLAALSAAMRDGQAALAEREADLAALLDSMGDGVVAVGVDGRVRRLNPVACRLVGMAEAAAVDRPLHEVLRLRQGAPEGGPGAPAAGMGTPEGGSAEAAGRARALVAAVATGEPRSLRSADGAAPWVTVTAAPIRDAGGAVAGEVLVVRDITAQRDLEAQVRQAHKVEAIGQLAGGVAHDFNNMLTPILAYAELIKEAEGATEEVRAFAGTVAETAARAAALTRQLLAFSRKGTQERRPVDLDRLAEETLALLRRTLDRRIEVVAELRARTPVLADAALVQNALLNLALNARDAMPAGGTLRVAARRVEVAPEDCRPPGFTLTPGPHVELTVSDTGQGMTPEVLARIFEPFFTTKEVGKGTGLGLPAVHGTMKEHGGAVVVSSEPGRGTTFRLLFPAGAGAEPADRPERRPPRLRGRALVVEDEAAVRAVVVHQLRAMGLDCEVASDGEEGLAAAGRAAGLRLAVLDLVLPRRHGREVLARLREVAPGLPVLLCSGYDRDADLPTLLALPRVARLAKPFRPSELAEAVERLLGDGPPPLAPPPG